MLKRIYFNLIKLLSFGYIASLETQISELFNDNKDLIDINVELNNTLVKHRDLNSNLQSQINLKDVLLNDCYSMIKELSEKDYNKRCDEVNTWLMRNFLKKVS